MLIPFVAVWAMVAQPSSLAALPLKQKPEIVTIVHVRTPWYGFPFVLRRGFAKAGPIYKAIPGLLTKEFTYSRHPASFGGVYTWQSREAAEAWFAPSWFERVRHRYHTEGRVDYYTVDAVLVDRPLPAETGDFYTVVSFSPARQELLATPALVRVLEVSDGRGRKGTVSLWTNERDAEAILGRGADVEYLRNPRRIDNR